MNDIDHAGVALLEETDLRGYADPKNNLAFLRLFASDRNKDLTKHLLNSMLGLSGPNAIVEIHITDPRIMPEDLKEKSNIIDIYCKDEKEHRFVIEMQVQQQDFFFQRAMHVTCNAFANQLKSGENYSELNPVWFLGILDFEMFPEPDYFSEHRIINWTLDKFRTDSSS